MTIRQLSPEEALRAFSGAAVRHDLHPLQEVGTRRYGATCISYAILTDPVFSSPWFGHASGSQSGETLSPQRCLAGAYGEMIENVSCDLWYPDWLPCRREIAPLWDERRVDVDECIDTLPPGSGLRATMAAASPRTDHRVHRYVGLAGGEELLFPREIGLEVVGRNNGGAVGSTISEAIVAALFETFERYALRKFALRTARFPLIDPETLAGGPVDRIAAHLRAQGRELHYLDMTLGGRLPVVGVLLVDPALDSMSLAVAGGHRVEHAVEHCAREMLSDEYYGDRVVGWSPAVDTADLVRAWSRAGFTAGWGGSLAQVELEKPYSRDFRAAFELPVRNTASLLGACLRICRRFDADVFVRDCSILDVAAVHVYAGTLSEYSFVAHEGLLGVEANARALVEVSRDRWLHEHLPALDRCSRGDFEASRSLAALLDNPFVGRPDSEDVCDYFSWPVSSRFDAAVEQRHRGVPVTMLVAGLRYHAGDLAEAARLWRRLDPDPAGPARSVGHFLDLAATSGDLPDTKRRFGSAFGTARLEEVERALALETLLRIPLRPGDSEVEQIWERFRRRMYPRPGEWRAPPLELGRGSDAHAHQ